MQSPEKPVILPATAYSARRSQWITVLPRRPIKLRPRPKLPSQVSFNSMRSPLFRRNFILREHLRFFGSSRPLGFLSESQSYRPFLASWCRSRLSRSPSSSYQVWTSDKIIPTSIVHPFRSNVIDFDSQPRCWAGSAFDYVHYSVPRQGLDDIVEDLGLGRVSDYRFAVLEDDIVVAQITKSILPFLGRSDALSVLALDQFSLILGAHLIQQYGVLQKAARHSKGGLVPWQKRRASELLHENLHGRIRLSEVARECGLSPSHFARSFKTSFGISTHQWLIQHRIEHAKALMSQSTIPLMEIAVQSGFNDQAAFTRTFHQLVGVSPGRWRRHHNIRERKASVSDRSDSRVSV
jgi:AraC family transcriptional regulator